MPCGPGMHVVRRRRNPGTDPRPAASFRLSLGAGVAPRCVHEVRCARTDQGGQAMHRFVRLTLAIAIAAAAGAVSRPAHAAGPVPPTAAKPAAGAVAVELTAKRVTKDQGKEVLVAADEAKPGELLEYRALYRNDGATEAKGLMARSEEHTSELQSQFHLVCRLLLEKKKKDDRCRMI